MATTPTFEIALEDITNGANDGYYFGQTGGLTGYNNWGGHQNRILQDKDGYIWAIYLSMTGGVTTWNLMKRNNPVSVITASGWTKQASATTFDDVDLLLDQRDGTIYVTAFPSGVFSIYSSRDNFASTQPVAGNWESLTASSRHYGGVGISPDGTIGFKASRENVVIAQQTDSTNTEYVTMRFNLDTKRWASSTFVQHFVGPRCSYDYIFPNPKVGGLPDGIYGLSGIDLANYAAGYLARPSNQYQFPGFKYWYSRASTAQNYWEYMDRIRDLNAATAVIDATYRPMDALITSKGYMIVLLFADGDGSAAYTQTYKNKGTWILVFDQYRRLVQENRISALNTYGDSRLIEDPNGNLYLFWTNQGSTTGQCRLHRVLESSRKINGDVYPYFTVQGTTSSGFTDLTSRLNNYAPADRCPMVARPRAGSCFNSNYHADVLLRFYNKLNDGNSYNTSNAVAYAAGGQRTMYARLLLTA